MYSAFLLYLSTQCALYKHVSLTHSLFLFSKSFLSNINTLMNASEATLKHLRVQYFAPGYFQLVDDLLYFLSRILPTGSQWLLESSPGAPGFSHMIFFVF